MVPDLAQPITMSDQERMANLIRQCMAPLPTVRLCIPLFPVSRPFTSCPGFVKPEMRGDLPVQNICLPE